MIGAWSYAQAEEEINAEIDARGRRAPGGQALKRPEIRATPFLWTDPARIPRREWLYGRHLIRRYLSATIAPGGSGKSSLIVAEALAMVTGRSLLGDQPAGCLRVWHVNLEDPEDELQRRVTAAALHYGISPEDIADRLYLSSGRNMDMVIATESRDGIEIAVPVVEAIKAEIIGNSIDVVQVDPFVACHTVSENDNTKIAAVARVWATIAEETNAPSISCTMPERAAVGRPSPLKMLVVPVPLSLRCARLASLTRCPKKRRRVRASTNPLATSAL
jgi:hypothetical protein